MFTSCISSHDNNTKYKSLETESKTINQSNNTEQKIYIDVRTQEEWDTWHIENAIHIPLSDIQDWKNLDKIPTDRPVHLYCRSGNRSEQAIKILEQQWFNNLINAWGINNIPNATIIR